MATYETAKDQYITINSIKYAYRQFGRSGDIPLLMHMYFRGTMDHWDAALINPLAARRPIIILDSAGVGRSEGEIPTTFAGWAQVVLDFVKALGINKLDLFGFSMGGCAAQLIALNAPQRLVRRLILAGTITSAGEGVVIHTDMSPNDRLRLAKTREEHLDAYLHSFFSSSKTSQAAGKASFERIHSARSNRTDYVDVEKAQRQLMCAMHFGNPDNALEGSYDRFHELTMPVLIANGANDLILPTANSYLMFRKLCKANAQLHLYPDSGHGFLYQYAAQFSKLINDFLDDPQLEHSESLS